MTRLEKAPAYWINPDGEIVPIGTHHIDDVIRNASDYGLDKDHIKAMYEEANEPMGLEGKAREKIMLEILKKGWTRVRYNGRNDLWTIQVWDFRSKDIKNNIWDFLASAVQSGISGKFADVRILDIHSDQVISSSSEDLLSGKVWAKRKSKGADFLMVKYGDIAYGRSTEASSMGRVVDHLNHGFVTMSAFKSSYSYSENAQRQRELMDTVREMGYGYIMCDGKWVDYKGSPASSEDTIMIPNMTREEGIELGKRFQQDAVIVKDSAGFDMVSTNPERGEGEIYESFNNVHVSMEDFVKAFTRLKYGKHSKFRFYHNPGENRFGKAYVEFRSHTASFGSRHRSSVKDASFVTEDGLEFDSFVL